MSAPREREPDPRAAPGAAAPAAEVAGSCLCGGVRFAVRPPFLRAGHCHCTRCRKHSGGAVSTQGRVPGERFRLIAGADLVRVFAEPGHASKAFCARCGSSLFGGEWPDGAEVSIRLGALDADPGIRPQARTFWADRAPWDEVSDDLPRFPGALPPGWTPPARPAGGEPGRDAPAC